MSTAPVERRAFTVTLNVVPAVSVTGTPVT